MKIQKRLVEWGCDKGNHDLLIAVNLRESDSKADVYTIYRKDLTDELIRSLEENWVNGESVEFPKKHTYQERDLTDDSLLPEDVLAKKPGVFRRTQNEWAFYILSNKLLEAFLLELESLKDDAKDLKAYSRELFDRCKSFWERVLEHKKENNFSNEHLDQIKDDLNQIFDQLKTLRRDESKVFDEESNEVKNKILEQVQKIRESIDDNSIFKDLMEKLKGVQNESRGAKLRRKHREIVHQALNEAFEEVKSRRKTFQSGKLQARINGLQKVIDKMEKSINYDKKERDFQMNRIDNGRSSPLEVQLRQAKLNMIEDKIQSKESKLADIYQTMEGLKNQIPETPVEPPKEDVTEKKAASLKKAETKKDSPQKKEQVETEKQQQDQEDAAKTEVSEEK